MHSGHGFAYDTMRRAEVYSRHPHLEAAGQDSLALQHSLASSAGLDHQVLIIFKCSRQLFLFSIQSSGCSVAITFTTRNDTAN